MHRRCGALAAALALVLACGRPDYFPLADNQQWRFAATESEVVPPDTFATATRTYTFAVTGSAIEAGLGRVHAVRVTRDGEPYLSFFFRKTRPAAFVLPASHLDGLEPTSGWLRLLDLPLREGAFWYGDAERSVSFEVIARETVVAPSGTYRNCFRIRIHASPPYLMDVWLAPGVGIVRWTRRFAGVRHETAERLRR